MTILTASTDQAISETRTWLSRPPAGQIIDGREVIGRGAQIEVDDPGTGRVLATIPAADDKDVDAAVNAARKAFDTGPWRHFSAGEREKAMRRLADMVERDRELLAELEVLETGKPIEEGRGCADEVMSVLRYYAGWADKAEGAVIPASNEFHAFTTRDPLGVCAAVTPWNYAISILSYKLAPALAMGNTLVIKPSELSPLGTLHMARLCTEAGIPDGVVNVVTGAGEVGAALSSHPGIDKVAFTGSTVTGRKVMTAAAAKPARVSLELGGKSAHVVFADANLEAAADSVFWGIFTNAGQVCVAGSRLLVEESVHDEFVGILAERARTLTLGHGLNPTSQMGPMITARQRANAYDQVAAAAREGATIVAGGRAIEAPGYFAEPTIVTDLSPDSALAQHELFGPVLSVLRFTSEDEAIAIANGTPYGLAAGLWTTNLRRAHTVAQRLVAGSVWVNTFGVFHPALPFGGVRGSGFGRELGAGAIEHYSETKTTVIGL